MTLSIRVRGRVDRHILSRLAHCGGVADSVIHHRGVLGGILQTGADRDRGAAEAVDVWLEVCVCVGGKDVKCYLKFRK